MVSGWIVLDKPEGITSAHAVAKVKHIFRRLTGDKPKIGHTGTLDPFATGILPLALGEATKLCQFLIDEQKSYDFEITWGEFRNTGDKTGEVSQTIDGLPTIQELNRILSQFRGDIMQAPHQFSAIKVDGQRAYDLARQGKEFELDKRPISIYQLDLLSHNENKTTFRSKCSKGTYIRVLAEDIAKALGLAGYVSMLRRTYVGGFAMNHAISLDNDDEVFYKKLLAPEIVLDGIPAISLSLGQTKKIQLGQSLFWDSDFPTAERFILKYNDKAVAIAIYENGLIRPKRVFNF